MSTARRPGAPVGSTHVKPRSVDRVTTMRGSPVGDGFPQSGETGQLNTLTRSCHAANSVLRVGSVGCGTDCSVMNEFDRNASPKGPIMVDDNAGWSYGCSAVVPLIGTALANVAPKSVDEVTYIAFGSFAPKTRQPTNSVPPPPVVGVPGRGSTVITRP
jgi:hypothetical protein